MTETQLFNFLEDRFGKVTRATNQFSTWDCHFDVDDGLKITPYYAELKCREKHYPDLLIERDKYDRLLVAATTADRRPVYICSTPNGIWAWDLFRVGEPRWEDRLMPATTEFDHVETITKSVGFLKVSEGRQLL